jgi:hypothetical protein
MNESKEYYSRLVMSLNNKRYLVVRVRGCQSSGSLCFQMTIFFNMQER